RRSLSPPDARRRGGAHPPRRPLAPTSSALLFLALAAGCAPPRWTGLSQPAATPTVTTSASPTSSPSPAPSPSPSPVPTHVFVIVMENKSATEALRGRYTAGLAQTYALATAYHAVSHPSLPNYLALTGGSNFGIRDDGYHPLPPGGLGAQLDRAGIPWR